MGKTCECIERKKNANLKYVLKVLFKIYTHKCILNRFKVFYFIFYYYYWTTYSFKYIYELIKLHTRMLLINKYRISIDLIYFRINFDLIDSVKSMRQTSEII